MGRKTFRRGRCNATSRRGVRAVEEGKRRKKVAVVADGG